jgi:hypothetical protein
MPWLWNSQIVYITELWKLITIFYFFLILHSVGVKWTEMQNEYIEPLYTILSCMVTIMLPLSKNNMLISENGFALTKQLFIFSYLRFKTGVALLSGAWPFQWI